MKFFKDEWDLFVDNCGFTDDEQEIVKFLRKEWYGVDIAAEVNISIATYKRRKKRIFEKISRYIAKTG